MIKHLKPTAISIQWGVITWQKLPDSASHAKKLHLACLRKLVWSTAAFLNALSLASQASWHLQYALVFRLD